ncbi:MAG: hypothetical protein KDD40_08665 [Bdellovibrionales bacterium]|nr:hypothetical protein [Bdellovibrionales bacterium]
MSIRPTYHCEACNTQNAMVAGVTVCWQCKKPHQTELYQPHFQTNSSGKVTVRSVDIIPADLEFTKNYSRIACPNCGASNPGVDVNTHQAPERCSNPECKDLNDLDKSGQPLPAKLTKNGQMNRLVFSDSNAHLVLVPESVALELDKIRYIDNTSDQLRAALRAKFIEQLGHNRISVKEIDDAIEKAMVKHVVEGLGLPEADIDLVIESAKKSLKMSNAIKINRPTESINYITSGNIDRNTVVNSWIKKHRKSVFSAVAATGISVTALIAAYGFSPHALDSIVTDITGNQVTLEIQVTESEQEIFKFNVKGDSTSEIRVGDKVSVHGLRWFGSYTGLGFESGGIQSLK